MIRHVCTKGGRSKSKKREGEKDLLGSGVEYCGTCLNGVRALIWGYRGTWLKAVRVIMGCTAVSGNKGLEGQIGGTASWLLGVKRTQGVWSWVHKRGYS